MDSIRRCESKRPEHKEPKPRKRALVVGISYKNINVKSSYLPGCINDARAVRQILIDKYGFRSSDVELMTDEPGSKTIPTGANIMAALKRMVRRAQSQDFLMFYFSGHGTLVPARASKTQKEEDAIVPWDLNLITSVDFRLLVKELPWYIDFIFVVDACHSGELIEDGKEQIGPIKDQYDDGDDDGDSDDDDDDDDDNDDSYHVVRTRPRIITFEDLMDRVYTMTGNNNLSRGGSHIRRRDDNYGQNVARQMLELYGDTASRLFRLPSDQIPRVMPKNGVLITACQRNEKAYECIVDGKSYGCFTHALLTRLRKYSKGMLFYGRLVKEVRETVQKKGGRQHPCLYSTDIFSYYPFADCWHVLH